MWSHNIIQGPLAFTDHMHKRHFGMSTLNTIGFGVNTNFRPDKIFENPNFNREWKRKCASTCCSKSCHSDNQQNKVTTRNLIDTIKITRPDIIPNCCEVTKEGKSPVKQQMCFITKKLNKCKTKSRRSGKKDKRKDMMEMMHMDKGLAAVEDTLEDELVLSDGESTDNEDILLSTSSSASVCAAGENLLERTLQKPPPFARCKQISICESEDSFIMFDHGDEESDITCTDDESYDETSCDETDDCHTNESEESYCTSTKKVKFADDDHLCVVHPMIQWSYAYQAARKGPWEIYARDGERFRNRIRNIEQQIKHVFEPTHRSRIYKERFAADDTVF